MKKNTLFLILFAILLPALSCTGPALQKDRRLEQEVDVVIFWGDSAFADVFSYREIARALGLTSKIVDGNFINSREEFFDFYNRRKFKVLIFPGGDAPYWFEKKRPGLPPQAEGRLTHNIDCQGVSNVLDFIRSGGSVIGICHCGTSLFSSRTGWLNPRLGDSGNLEKSYPDGKGNFNALCGTYAFKGSIIGPQKEVWPYPIALFLPLRMNPENEIVKEAKVPPVVHIMVTGAGSIIPDRGQPLDVVAWFPNGTAAIAVAPYGAGRIILSGPHPNIVGTQVENWRKAMMGDYAKCYGATEKTMQENWEKMNSNSDPDGSEPDWALAKAMLSHAYKKAAQ